MIVRTHRSALEIPFEAVHNLSGLPVAPKLSSSDYARPIEVIISIINASIAIIESVDFALSPSSTNVKADISA